MKKVFLGGTCAGSDWRDQLIGDLEITYFNPVVSTGDWDENAQKREIQEREESDFVLYVITPKMKGAYSIAEVIDDTHRSPEKTVFCVLEKDDGKTFSEDMKKSLKAVSEMVERNGSKVCSDLKEVAKYLNSKGGKVKSAKGGGDLEKAMHLLEVAVLVAEGKEPNIPGLDMLGKNLERRENTLSIRSKRFLANLGKLRSIIKKITEAADAEASNADGEPEIQERSASMIETPESSKECVSEVREVTAGINTGDAESVSLYTKRETKPDGKNPSNVHDEMLGLTKKSSYDIDFGVGKQATSDSEDNLLSSLYGDYK